MTDTPAPRLYGDTFSAYYELIYAVGTKHPGETRHQTALRYIKEAETKSTQAAQAKPKDHGEQ